MSNLFNFIKPMLLTIPGETEGIKIGVAKEYAELLWLTPLVGIAMVFAVLTILWGVLVLFKLIFARPKKEKAKSNKKTDEASKSESTVDATAVVAPVAATDDSELIAVLTAAIYAYESEQNPNEPIGNFRVVSYRRTNGGRSWNAK
jgi:sodium pump decarboxylase gamma subunit